MHIDIGQLKETFIGQDEKGAGEAGEKDADHKTNKRDVESAAADGLENVETETDGQADLGEDGNF